jgi:outer membrane murein-binding lipoprotein Lpp
VKTVLVTTIAAVVAATTLAAPASSATPSERRLARQVKTLQRQVKTLNRQVRALQRDMREVRSVAQAGLVYSACLSAATADAFQGTWETIDRVGARLTPPQGPFDQYPAQTPVVDPINSCQGLELQRQPNTVPPTTNVFAALLNLFR